MAERLIYLNYVMIEFSDLRIIKIAVFQMHRKGIKLGIYGDYGIRTCMGYPGILNDLQLDANTFAEWNVDMLKLDGCHSKPNEMNTGRLIISTENLNWHFVLYVSW